MNTKQAICICILAYGAATAGAQTILNAVPYITSEEAVTLEKGDGLTRFFFSREEAKLRYAPETFSTEIIAEKVASMDPTLGVESLYFIPYREDESPREAYEKAGHILFSVSSMEGIEYYSASRERMRTLFTESVVIDSVRSDKPVEDLHFDTLPASVDFLVRQTDLTFGTNIYTTSFKGDEETLWFSMKNLTKMRYKFITMVGPESLEIHLLIHPLEKGMLFYGVCSVKSVSFFGLERSKKDSFFNRIEAMENWFENQYHYSNIGQTMQ
jgi:hypothetical protein